MSKLTASMLSSMIAGSDVLQNNIDVSDLEPGTYTLQFSVINIQPSPNLQIMIPPVVHALITWKIEGQQQRRQISVVSGASISGVCEAVDVKLQDINNQEDEGYGYQVQVTLSKGLRANTQQPPQLSRGRLILVPPSTSAIFPVPDDSGVISFFPFFDTTHPDDMGIAMTDAVNNTVATITPAPNALGWIPLVPGTTVVSLNNNNATDGMFCNLLWGIDG